MAKIVVNLPNSSKGTLVDIPGVGSFENGYEYETDRLEEDQVFGLPLGEGPSADTEQRDEELYTQAQKLDIYGRSTMSNYELQNAVDEALAADLNGEGE